MCSFVGVLKLTDDSLNTKRTAATSCEMTQSSSQCRSPWSWNDKGHLLSAAKLTLKSDISASAEKKKKAMNYWSTHFFIYKTAILVHQTLPQSQNAHPPLVKSIFLHILVSFLCNPQQHHTGWHMEAVLLFVWRFPGLEDKSPQTEVIYKWQMYSSNSKYVLSRSCSYYRTYVRFFSLYCYNRI